MGIVWVLVLNEIFISLWCSVFHVRVKVAQYTGKWILMNIESEVSGWLISMRRICGSSDDKYLFQKIVWYKAYNVCSMYFYFLQSSFWKFPYKFIGITFSTIRLNKFELQTDLKETKIKKLSLIMKIMLAKYYATMIYHNAEEIFFYGILIKYILTKFSIYVCTIPIIQWIGNKYVNWNT